jgi:SAM-dependent methyltransferase
VSSNEVGGIGEDGVTLYAADHCSSASRDITDAMRRHYDRLVESYVEAFFHDISDSPWVDRLLRRLPAGAHILDAGCGPGRLARYMVDQGYRVTGIDISSAMVEAARRLVPEAAFAEMDMSRLEFPDGSFDGIFSAYSFFHVPPGRVDPSLREFQRVLVPGGLAGFIVKRGDGEHVEPSPLVPGERCWVQLWADQDFEARLQSYGFEVVERDSAPADSPEELPFERIFFLVRLLPV